jgi:hypothetical protein
MSKYRFPKPVDFNTDAWNVSSRALWCETNRLKPGEAPPVGEESELPAAAPSLSTESSATADPPPTRATASHKFNCPVCGFGHKHGYGIAEHQ